MRKPLTPEQIAKRDARRAEFKALWARVSALTEEQRAAECCKYGFISADGHAYSGTNTLLIALQRPGATVLGGFRQWLKHGRAVRKGERGISIWVPIGYKSKEVTQNGAETTSTDKTGFTNGTIFDISQTDQATAGAAPQNDEVTP